MESVSIISIVVLLLALIVVMLAKYQNRRVKISFENILLQHKAGFISLHGSGSNKIIGSPRYGMERIDDMFAHVQNVCNPLGSSISMNRNAPYLDNRIRSAMMDYINRLEPPTVELMEFSYDVERYLKGFNVEKHSYPWMTKQNSVLSN